MLRILSIGRWSFRSIAKVRRVVPLTVVAVTKLVGSASLQFVCHTAVGVYIRRSRYAEVINRRINTPIALKELTAN